MDQILINGLQIETTIGVHAWERPLPQTLTLDLVLHTNICAAATGDNIDQALDYHQISYHCRQFCARQSFQLLETLAETLCAELLATFTAQSIELCIHKPGAVAHAQSVGVRIHRSRKTAV